MSAFPFGSGGAGSNTPNKPLFGAATGTSGSTTPSLFGTTANNSNTSSGTPGAKPIFGSALGTGGSNLFGGTSSSSTPASSKPGGLFGAPQAASGAQPAVSFGFGNGGGNMGSGAGAANPVKSPLFGSGIAGGAVSGTAPSFSFSNASSASTPAASKSFTLNSTTPAGPPPGPNLFSSQANQTNPSSQQPTSSLFGTKSATTSASAAPSPFAPAASNFGAVKPSDKTSGGGSGFLGLGNKEASTDGSKTTSAQQTPAASGFSLFGGAAASGASGTPGAQATPKQSLFSLGNTTSATTPASKPPTFSLGSAPASGQPAPSQPPVQGATTPANPLSAGASGLVPASTGAAASNLFQSATPTSGTAGGLLNFQKSSAAPSTIIASATAAGAAGAPAGSSPFPTLGGGSAPTPGAPASTSTSGPSLFQSIGGKPTVTSSQPSTTAATSAPTSATTTGAGTANTLGSSTAGGDAAKGGLAGSTAGPAPSTQSRLKNKSMDEIITRWAADLSKYQKEFQQQAEQVAAWDRALVDNSEKVKQLYSKTFQAERDAHEVERQLSLMEENQQELEMYLDRYEKEVENLMRAKGLGGQGRPEGLRGPDQERERTYKLAEKLQDRLNELNKDLTEMIEEINNTSQTLSKTGKADDPLTKVVRVLNSQLSQLQLIDSGASQLQEKINKAQKESQRVGANGWNGLGTNPADDFYRSFGGGRTDRFGGVS